MRIMFLVSKLESSLILQFIRQRVHLTMYTNMWGLLRLLLLEVSIIMLPLLMITPVGFGVLHYEAQG